MSATFQLQVLSEDNRPVFLNDYSKRVEIGRQDRGESAPYSHRFEGDHWRIVVAPLTEDTVSRHHLSIDPIAEGVFRIRNGSRAIPIRFSNGEDLRPGESREMPLPFQIMLGRRMIRVVSTETVSNAFQELPEATLPPGTIIAAPTLLSVETRSASHIRWLRGVIEVLQAAASSSDFFDKAARAAAEMVGLDSVGVWLHRDGEWVQEAHFTLLTRQPTKTTASRLVLNRVLQRARTLWDKPEVNATSTNSLDSVAAVVASPILDRDGTVIGVLYGDRSYLSARSHSGGGLIETDAMLFEVLASGISAGLERLRQEQAAIAARVHFEQFFTHDLAIQLERNPELLKGRASEVSILFCSIRGFQRISRNLGSEQLFGWINDLLGDLSECVVVHHGVLVDYNEDELMAMWGAPTEQPGHANLACGAATAMIDAMSLFNEKWLSVLGEKIELNIGINSGLARVGNVGSVRKFKYGPLGPTVSLARRMQGVARRLRAGIVIGGPTQSHLDEAWLTRRLGRFQLPDIDEREDLFEPAPRRREGWAERCDAYEEALRNFEAARFREASRALAILRSREPDDGPARWLLTRAIRLLVEKPTLFDPAENLVGE